VGHAKWPRGYARRTDEVPVIFSAVGVTDASRRSGRVKLAAGVTHGRRGSITRADQDQTPLALKKYTAAAIGRQTAVRKFESEPGGCFPQASAPTQQKAADATPRRQTWRHLSRSRAPAHRGAANRRPPTSHLEHTNRGFPDGLARNRLQRMRIGDQAHSGAPCIRQQDKAHTHQKHTRYTSEG